MRIFNLGMGRTGTKSFHTLMLKSKLSSVHEPSKDSLFVELEKDIDSFSGGLTHRYKEIYEIYPDAKYILTVRNAESWLLSRIRLHYSWIHSLDEDLGMNLFFSKDCCHFLETIDDLMRRYNEINEEIIDFFKDKENFMVLNFIDSTNKNKLASKLFKFLEIASVIEFPHENNNKRGVLGHQ